MWHTVRVGTNTFVGRTAALTRFRVGGSRLFEVRARGGSGLMVDGEFYDAFGVHLGSITNNRWARQQAHAVVRTQLERVQICDPVRQVPLLDVWTVGAELVVDAIAMSSRDGKRCELDSTGTLEISASRSALSDQTISNRVIETTLDDIDLAKAGAEILPMRRASR